MGRWVFIRHGESKANASRIFSGWNDVPLTPLGVTQARRAGRLLAEHTPGPIHVVSSDLQRAHRTGIVALKAWSAALRCPAPEIVLEPRLRERHMGVLQGVSIDAARRDGRMSQLLGWKSHPPGGESLYDLAIRCLAAVQDIDEGCPVVIFAHGGVIRVLSGMLDRLTTEQIASRRIQNAHPIIMNVDHELLSDCSERYALRRGK